MSVSSLQILRPGFWLLLAALVLSPRADAVPSFARQTGVACGACHVQAFGPKLNTFGREFKLNGHTLGSNAGKLPPISVMLNTSFTHTRKRDPELADSPELRRRFNANSNVALDEVSLLYAGKIAEHLGTFIQVTYDGVAKDSALDHFELRHANSAALGYHRVIGSRDFELYNNDSGFAGNGRPGSDHYVAELDYRPFGKGHEKTIPG